MRGDSRLSSGLMLLIVSGVVLCPFGVKRNSPGPVLVPALISAEETWRKEFDEICSRTDQAELLTTAELKELIGRADRLKPSLERLDESARKVYLKRLQMCRDLYGYTLSVKESR